jgi:hypothetical protein
MSPKYIDLLERSYNHNITYNDIIIYTDKDTYPSIRHISKDIEVIDNFNPIFMDDFKVRILPLLGENQILTDFDIFLKSKLALPQGYDLYIEREGRLKENLTYHRIISHIESEGFNVFKEDIETYCNVGFMKTHNPKLIELLLEKYYNLRNWYVNNSIREKNKVNKKRISDFVPSVIALQYQLEVIVIQNSFKKYELYKCNRYNHLSGESKFKHYNNTSTLI